MAVGVDITVAIMVATTVVMEVVGEGAGHHLRWVQLLELLWPMRTTGLLLFTTHRNMSILHNLKLLPIVPRTDFTIRKRKLVLAAGKESITNF
jgi:hypothetical protein